MAVGCEILLACCMWAQQQSLTSLKKLVHLEPVNQKLLQQLKPEDVEVDIVRVEMVEEADEAGVEEAELDEMWSFVGKKTNPRWL